MREQLADVRREVWRRRFGEAVLPAGLAILPLPHYAGLRVGAGGFFGLSADAKGGEIERIRGHAK